MTPEERREYIMDCPHKQWMIFMGNNNNSYDITSIEPANSYTVILTDEEWLEVDKYGHSNLASSQDHWYFDFSHSIFKTTTFGSSNYSSKVIDRIMEYMEVECLGDFINKI